MRSITYGTESAPHQLSVFFDIQSPDFLSFFNQTVPLIRQVWVEDGEAQISLIPYPLSQETIFFMFCYDTLEPLQRQIFFELLMEMNNPTIDAMGTLLSMLIGHSYGLAEQFKLHTPALLQEVNVLRDQYQFETSPVLFFDDSLLSEQEQRNLFAFLDSCQTNLGENNIYSSNSTT